jgi:hypothetical protein
LFAELRRLRELVERLASQPQPERAWVTVSEAASLIFRTEAAIRKRCRTHGIGVRVRGRWQVDSILLEQLLRGRSRVTAPRPSVCATGITLLNPKAYNALPHWQFRKCHDCVKRRPNLYFGS